MATGRLGTTLSGIAPQSDDPKQRFDAALRGLASLFPDAGRLDGEEVLRLAAATIRGFRREVHRLHKLNKTIGGT